MSPSFSGAPLCPKGQSGRPACAAFHAGYDVEQEFRETAMKAPSPSILAAALSLACATTAFAAADEKLKAAAEAAQPALIETLHEMVLIESGSGDVEGLARMADLTEARLK